MVIYNLQKPYHWMNKWPQSRPFLLNCDNQLAVKNQRNGMVEWNSGMEYWNDLWPLMRMRRRALTLTSSTCCKRCNQGRLSSAQSSGLLLTRLCWLFCLLRLRCRAPLRSRLTAHPNPLWKLCDHLYWGELGSSSREGGMVLLGNEWPTFCILERFNHSYHK